MRSRSPLFVFVALLVALAVPARADDFDELRRLHKELSVAIWTGDALWFEENLADEYLLINPAGLLQTKRDFISELTTPGTKMEPFDPSEVQIRLFGDMAVITGRMLQHYTVGRIRAEHDRRYTDVFVKKKGRWMLVSGHVSNVTDRS